MMIAGRCHCRNLSFELDWQGAGEIPARACDCSFCVKHGGVWTSHPSSALDVTIGDPALVSAYTFGTGTAAFQVCARCGVVPLVTCEIGGRLYAVVNVNAFEGIDRSSVVRSTATFEGEELESRLARRQRSWIGTVRIHRRGRP